MRIARFACVSFLAATASMALSAPAHAALPDAKIGGAGTECVGMYPTGSNNTATVNYPTALGGGKAVEVGGVYINNLSTDCGL